MKKIFRNTIKMQDSERILKSIYYYNSDSCLLLKSEIMTTGGALWIKDSGEAVVFQSPGDSLDPLVQKMSIQDVIKADHDKAIEQGYEEIASEEFMKMVDKKYPGWREQVDG